MIAGIAGGQTTPTVADTSVFPTPATNTSAGGARSAAGTVAAPKIYTGVGGGTTAVSETTDAVTGHITRTLTYVDYVNGEGMILNGTESTDQSAAQNKIHYIVDIAVTGTHTGSLTGDATVDKLTRVITPTTPTSQIQVDPRRRHPGAAGSSADRRLASRRVVLVTMRGVPDGTPRIVVTWTGGVAVREP